MSLFTFLTRMTAGVAAGLNANFSRVHRDTFQGYTTGDVPDFIAGGNYAPPQLARSGSGAIYKCSAAINNAQADPALDAAHWVLFRFAEAGAAILPPWSGAANPAASYNSTIAETVVDSRTIAAGTLQPNDIVEGVIQAYITQGATHGIKYLRACVDADISGSLLANFDAGVTGSVVVRTRLIVNNNAPHTLITTVDLNETANWLQLRGQVAVNLATQNINLQTRLWLQNNADSVVLDSSSWRLNRTGL